MPVVSVSASLLNGSRSGPVNYAPQNAFLASQNDATRSMSYEQAQEMIQSKSTLDEAYARRSVAQAQLTQVLHDRQSIDALEVQKTISEQSKQDECHCESSPARLTEVEREIRLLQSHLDSGKALMGRCQRLEIEFCQRYEDKVADCASLQNDNGYLELALLMQTKLTETIRKERDVFSSMYRTTREDLAVCKSELKITRSSLADLVAKHKVMNKRRQEAVTARTKIQTELGRVHTIMEEWKRAYDDMERQRDELQARFDCLVD